MLPFYRMRQKSLLRDVHLTALLQHDFLYYLNISIECMIYELHLFCYLGITYIYIRSKSYESKINKTPYSLKTEGVVFILAYF